MSKFFTSDKISERVTRIAGQANDLCYLIEGDDRALLIDGLTGVGSLKAYVRELTDKPVQVALTHGHLDHTGAAWEYGQAWIHPDDIALMFTPMFCSDESRYQHVFNRNADSKVQRSDVVPQRTILTWPLREGDVFDLGSVQLEAILVPGHTHGSMVFLDRASRVLYSGDACNANTLICLPGSTTVEEYLDSLLHFKTYQSAFDVMYGGHGKTAIPNTIIDDAIAMCHRILDGTDEHVPVPSLTGETAYLGSARSPKYLPVCGGFANIMYSDKGIRRVEKPRVITDSPII